MLFGFGHFPFIRPVWDIYKYIYIYIHVILLAFCARLFCCCCFDLFCFAAGSVGIVVTTAVVSFFHPRSFILMKAGILFVCLSFSIFFCCFGLVWFFSLRVGKHYAESEIRDCLLGFVCVFVARCFLLISNTLSPPSSTSIPRPSFRNRNTLTLNTKIYRPSPFPANIGGFRPVLSRCVDHSTTIQDSNNR